ncbi:MAG: site-specific DNA-methyltransferase [Verrucomicrobiota bacterium]
MECADCLDYLGGVETGSVGLVVTSPPYNMGKAYERRRSLERYVAEQERTIAECVRVLGARGSICWQVGNFVEGPGRGSEVYPLDVVLYPLFKKHGLTLKNRIVWHFEHGLHCSSRLSGRHETILWFVKSEDYVFDLDAIRVPAKYPNKKHFKGPNKGKLSGNPLGKNPGDVWVIPNVKANHVEKTGHPCQYPVELVERLVLALTEEGDVVLDPYAGVGSSLVAAVKRGREGRGCDLDAGYVATARERLAALEAGELLTRPMGRPVYEPKSR